MGAGRARGESLSAAAVSGPVRATALAFVLALTSSTVAFAAKAGDRAGDLTLRDKNGKTVTLKSLRGKVVVLDFWASWCGPCKKELPALDKLARTYKDEGARVVVVAVNIDKERAKADRFLKTAGISALTSLYDPSGASAGTYDLPTMPTSFVIDGKGIIRHVHAGFTSGDEKSLQREVDALLRTL